MINRLFADVHILQTVPPSNLNRDDAGSPKHATYGGVRRSRVSSQAWKRATRLAFTDQVDTAELGVRTKRIARMLATELADRGLDADQSARVAKAAIGVLGITEGKKANDTAYLLFFGRPQLAAIATALAERADELISLSDKDLEAAVKTLPIAAHLTTGHPIDVALFGRMVANIPALNVDAAVQVAHALSTHAVDIEFDYYTAVDDENDADETGAGMIGTVEFNSATLYRYATIGVHQLLDNLADPKASATAVDLFVDTFARSMPTGHQNSFAHRTMPHLVVVALRTDQPINLVSAFEKPVMPLRSGIAGESLAQLAAEFTAVTTTWGRPPQLTAATYTASNGVGDKLAEAFGPSLPFPDLQRTVRSAVAGWLAGGATA